jgi:hypothetical protein
MTVTNQSITNDLIKIEDLVSSPPRRSTSKNRPGESELRGTQPILMQQHGLGRTKSKYSKRSDIFTGHDVCIAESLFSPANLVASSI